MCVCDGDLAELCASACAGASVCPWVRLPCALSRAPCALPRRAASPNGLRLQSLGRSRRVARHPRPRLRPAPGRACAAPRELRRARGAGGRGGGELRRRPGPESGGITDPSSLLDPDLGRLHPATPLGVPADTAPAPRGGCQGAPSQSYHP
ncbi:unnamed protein product, partial [Rangifer tarandus platyrhynchus]|uniref:Uncharacterized protein n=1 Tax=Rangifer tarandus platyrhynchus TaxID=3082113 RepID=A0AC59Z914_RANTA